MKETTVDRKKDPGFAADIMAMGGCEEARRLLRLLGVAETVNVCEHDWHGGSTLNGVPVYHCQKCGKRRKASREGR